MIYTITFNPSLDYIVNWPDEVSPLVKLTKNRELYAPRELVDLDPSVVFMRGRR